MIHEWWIEKDLEGSSHGLTEILSQHLSGNDTEKPQKTSLEIASALAEIQTEHFPNTSLEH
jgi:hypothetical protein